MVALWNDRTPPAKQRTLSTRSVLAVAPNRPGRFRYSNLAYVVVGAAIDRIADMPYEEALRVHVLEPLGITSAGFGPPPEVCGHRPRLQLGPLLIGRARRHPPTMSAATTPNSSRRPAGCT